jgi:hypothetical protein
MGNLCVYCEVGSEFLHIVNVRFVVLKLLSLITSWPVQDKRGEKPVCPDHYHPSAIFIVVVYSLVSYLYNQKLRTDESIREF